MKYSFGSINIDINCKKEYNDYFQSHLEVCLNDRKPKVSLYCYENAIIKIACKKTVVKSISISDMYFILFNSLANLINDSNNLLIHSSAITNEKETIIILGDFGSGKSTLAQLAEKHNYKILSTDQTWVQIDDNKLKIKYGSILNKTKTGYESKILNTDKNYVVTKIILIRAVVKGGIYYEKIYTNSTQIKKRMAKCLFWSSQSPVGKKNMFLKLNYKKANKAFNKILELNLPFKEVWGYENIIANF